jgi:hypothetical protein
MVLGPAAALLHAVAPGAVPPPEQLFALEHIERLRGHEASGEAAIWIHLWAVTVLLVVAVPRVLLAWGAGWREQRLAHGLRPPLDEPYFLRILSVGRGAGMRVEVVPYGYRPTPPVAERIRALLLDLFGSRTLFHAADPVGYGETLAPTAPDPGQSTCIAVVVSLAQSPEPEVHGELLETLRDRMEAAPGDARVLLLLDEDPYRERLEPDAPRLAERRRAWERLASDAGVGVVALSGRGGSDDETLRCARVALARPLPGARA